MLRADERAAKRPCDDIGGLNAFSRETLSYPAVSSLGYGVRFAYCDFKIVVDACRRAP